jgi:hypothetical protein
MCVQFFGVVFLTLSWVVGGVVVPSLVGARSDDPAHPMPAARRRLWVISGAGGSAAGGGAGRSRDPGLSSDDQLNRIWITTICLLCQSHIYIYIKRLLLR